MYECHKHHRRVTVYRAVYALCIPRAAALMCKIHQCEVKQSQTDVCCARHVFTVTQIFTSENLFTLFQKRYSHYCDILWLKKISKE